MNCDVPSEGGFNVVQLMTQNRFLLLLVRNNFSQLVAPVVQGESLCLQRGNLLFFVLHILDEVLMLTVYRVQRRKKEPKEKDWGIIDLVFSRVPQPSRLY